MVKCDSYIFTDVPGDIKEWETNTVLDEDGEVVHIQHGCTGEVVDRDTGMKTTSFLVRDMSSDA